MIFCLPGKYRKFGYETADEARATALVQLNWYREQVDAGLLNFVKCKSDLPAAGTEIATGPLGAIMLMEGADAPRTRRRMFRSGLRLRIAHRRTRMARHSQCRRTGEPGPLTDEGRCV